MRDRLALPGPLGRVPAAVLGALFSLAVKATGALLALALFAAAARLADPDAFGRLAVTYTAAAFVAALAVLGQDVLVIRSLAEARAAGDAGLERGALRFGWRVAAPAGLVAAALFLAAGAAGAGRLPLVEDGPALAAAAVFLLGQTLLAYTSHAARVVCGVAVSEPHGEVTWRLVTLAALGAGALAGAAGGAGTARLFFAGAAAGSLLAALVQAVAVHRRLTEAVRCARPVMRPRIWAARSARIAASTAAEAAGQHADVLLVGLLASPAAASAYFVAARFANVFAMIGGGLHGYTSSRFAGLHHAGDAAGAQALLRTVIAVAAVLVGGLGLAVALGAGPLLGLFGAAYRDDAATLLVLSAGTAFAALMGPTPVVLMASGHERLYGRVLLAALVLRALALALAAPAHGALGAAAAVTAVNAPTALLLALACRRLVGADPSVAALLRSPRIRNLAHVRRAS